MKVSIVIPVYNVSDYIERCILSVMNQTYKDIECLIVNDCTPDDSMTKCQKLLNSYRGPIRFVILNHDKNRGQAAARNTGTEVASGEYIYYLDSDDDITPNCIEYLMEVAIKDIQIEMVQGNQVTCRGESKEIFYKGDAPLSIIGNEMVRCYTHGMKGIDGSPCNKLMRRTFLADNHIRFREGIIFEDMLWMFYMKKYLTNVRILPQTTYNYRVRPNSTITGTKMKFKIENWILLFDDMLTNLTSGKEKVELKDNVGVFISTYLTATPITPGKFDGLFARYMKLSRKYNAWEVYLTLLVARTMNKLNIGIDSLDRIIAIRWKIMKALKLI